MAMFAGTLKTLKSRTGELASQIAKAVQEKEDGRGGEPDFEDLDFSVANPGAPVLIRYSVQNATDADQEVSAFELPPEVDGDEVTVGLIRKLFPVPGKFHFRFKAATPDGSFGGYIWVDPPCDRELVPFQGGSVAMKALRLPDHVSVARGAARPVASQGPAAEVRRAAAPPAAVPNPAAAAVPNMSQGAPPPPPPVPHQSSGGLDIDLMAMDQPQAPKAAGGFSSSPPPPPQKLKSRAELVQEREDGVKAAVEEQLRSVQEQRKKEEDMKSGKVEAANKLGAELDTWARLPDGSGKFKDIKTLLCTTHKVAWEGSGWNELSLADVLQDSAVKKHYRKAITIFHPDKHQSAPIEQQTRAERIFQALNEAWKVKEG
mmetsp:Transcript_56023/g.133476  ORF Transcript_56023/g.133476 Transcript_56023/m.133476 type:complete len:374 (-) Transcript_56023:126-1247(-)